MNYLRAFVIGSILLVSGCAKDDPVSVPPIPLPPSIEGYWSGGSGTYLGLSFSLNQDRSQVLGSSSIRHLPNGTPTAGSISGTCTYPNIQLKMSMAGYFPIAITGTFTSPTTIVGELNDSGLSHVPFTIVK